MEYSTAALQLWNLNSQKKCVTSPRVRRILAVTRASVSWEEPGLFVSVHEDGAVCFVNRIPMNVKLASGVSVLRLKVSRVIWSTEMYWVEVFQNLIKSPWGQLTDKIKWKWQKELGQFAVVFENEHRASFVICRASFAKSRERTRVRARFPVLKGPIRRQTVRAKQAGHFPLCNYPTLK
jgi:hypothetical protein